MGGDFARAIGEAGLGFAQGVAEQKIRQNIETQQRQQQTAMSTAEALAARGELSNLPPEMHKSMMKIYGKEGFGNLLQLDSLNQTMRQLRMGAEESLKAPVQEETTVQNPMMQGPVTPQGEYPKQQVMMERDPTNVELYQRAQELGPLGTYYMTGDTAAGGLSAQQINQGLAQRSQQFEEYKYATGPGRKQQELLNQAEKEAIGQNRRTFRISKAEADEMNASGNVPEGFEAFTVGDNGLLVEVPRDAMKVDESVQTVLAGRGYKDIRKVPHKEIKSALAEVFQNRYLASAASAIEAKKAAKEMAEDARLWDVYRPRAESTVNVQTGQLAPASLKVKEADDKNWKVLPDNHKKVLQEVQQSRSSMEQVVRDFQKLYGKGGALADVKANLPSRTIASAKAYWNQLTQQNETLALLRDQAGQLAQALNRGSYGGVGTQTESDRKYAIKALTSIADGSFLLDTPEVQQKKINTIMKRFNSIEGTILGNHGKDFPGTIYMDIKQPANAELSWTTAPLSVTPAEAPTEQPSQPAQQQPQDMPFYEQIRDEMKASGINYTPEMYQQDIQEFQQQSGEKKNSEVGQDPYLQSAADEYGIPVDFLSTMSQIESSGDPNAVSPTGATGLFQFTRGTGQEYGLVGEGFDNRTDPEASAKAAAKLAANNSKALEKAGIEPEPYLLYLAHQQGVSGIKAIVKAAEEGRDVNPNIRKNMDLNGGKGLSPQEFLDMWQRRWERHEAEFAVAEG